MRLMLLPCLSLSAILWAAEPEKKDEVRVTFQALSLEAPIKDVGFAFGGKTHKLDIPNGQLGRVTEYAGPAKIAFFSVSPDDGSQPETTPELEAATRRLARATSASSQAAEAFAELTRQSDRLSLRTGENSGPASKEDIERAAELAEKLRQLGQTLSLLTKEREEIQREIAALKSLSKTEPAPAGRKKTVMPKTPKSLGEVRFRKDGAYLLLFSRMRDSYKLVSLEDGQDTFPFGSIQFVNLSGEAVTVRYPGIVASVPPNGRSVVTPPGALHDYAVGEIGFANRKAEEIFLPYRSLKHPEVRELVFLLADGESPEALQTRTIEDRRQTTGDRGRK